MPKRERIVGAVFLLMFLFAIVSLAFQLALDRLSGGGHSEAAYYVLGTLATAGASGYAGLFYFTARRSSPPPPNPSPPPDPQGDRQALEAEEFDERGPGYWFMRSDTR